MNDVWETAPNMKNDNRYGFVFAMLSEEEVLYGAGHDGGYKKDSWTYKISEGTWQQTGDMPSSKIERELSPIEMHKVYAKREYFVFVILRYPMRPEHVQLIGCRSLRRAPILRRYLGRLAE